MFFEKHRINCKVGEMLDSAVLKLQKDHWSDNGMGEGIFFSVWLGAGDIKKGRFNYNLHAFKMGGRKDYEIKPVAFAKKFRAGFDSSNWPNISIDYGPQNLFQGWMPLNLLTLGKDVSVLIDRFISVHSVIDDLLEGHKTAPRRA